MKKLQDLRTKNKNKTKNSQVLIIIILNNVGGWAGGPTVYDILVFSWSLQIDCETERTKNKRTTAIKTPYSYHIRNIYEANSYNYKKKKKDTIIFSNMLTVL